MRRIIAVIGVIAVGFSCEEHVKNVVDIVIPLGRVPAGTAMGVTAQIMCRVVVIFENKMDLALIGEFATNCFS